MKDRVNRILSNMTFRGKMLAVWLVAGIIPMVLVLFLFWGRVTGLVDYQNRYALRQNFEQTLLSVEDKVDNLREIATFLLADGTIQEAFRNNGWEKKTIDQYLEQYEAVETARRIFVDSNSVDEIVFYFNAENPIAGKSSGNKYRDISLLEQEAWCYSMLENNTSSSWGIIVTDPAAFMGDYFCYVHAVQDPADFGRTTGLICLGLELEKLEELLIPVLEEQYFYLRTAEGTVIGNDKDYRILETPQKEGRTSEGGIEYFYLMCEVDGTGMSLVSVIPEKVLTRQSAENLAVLLIVLLILMGAVFVGHMLLSNMLTKRVIQLAEACGNAEKGILTKVEDDLSADEIGILYRAYNQMTDRIEFLMEEQYRIGEEVKDAQLKALQAQINPHFLYNTLEMISWMVAREDKKIVQGIVRSLSKYYRSVLNRGRDEIRLQDEIQMGVAYMEIQGCRFKGKIRFTCETPDPLPDMEVPKLILQPLLENAIFHGITKKPEGRGNIWLKVYHEDEWIVLEVSDDGVGFCYDAERQETPGSRYGFGNIKKRIELFWKGKAALWVNSTPGIGTSIYIRMPVGQREQEEIDDGNMRES